MKRNIFIGFLIFLLVMVAAVYFWLPTKLLRLAEDKGSQAIQGDVKIEDLKIHWGFPLGVEIFNVRINQAALKAQITRVRASVDILNGLLQFKNPVLGVTVIFEKPELIYLLQEAQNTAKSEAASPLPPNQQDFAQKFSLKDLQLKFEIKEASIQIKKIAEDNKTQTSLIGVKEGNVDLALSSLNSPAQLKISGFIEPPAPYEKLSMPLQLETQLLLRDSKIQLDQSKISFFGLLAELKGLVDLSNQSQAWEIKAQSTDLAKVPTPSVGLPVTKWSGQFDLDAKISKASAKDSFKAAGQFHLQDFQGHLEWESEAAKAKGLVKAQMKTQFDFAEKLNIPFAQWDIDFTQLAIQYENLFEKPALTPLLLTGKGSYQDHFRLDDLKLKLGNLLASAQGKLSPDQSSDLHFEIAKTSLNGLEKMFLPIQQFPLQGEISANGSIKGPMMDPNKISLDLKDLKLRQVQGRLNWQSADKSIAVAGPFFLNANASAKVENMQLQDSNSSFQADLTGASITFKEVFKKSVGQLLKADMKTSGSVNKENPMQSNLKISGLANLGLDEYVYKKAAAVPGAAKEKTGAVATYNPEAFIESSPIINNAQVKLNVHLKKILFEDLVINEFRTEANIHKGILVSAGTIGQVFKGGLSWDKVSVPLTTKNPKIIGGLKAKGIALEQALGWMTPQWKDLAEGQAQLDMQFDTFMPSHPDFMKMLKAKGSFSLQDGVMKTLQFQQMAAEQLAKIPGLGGKFTPRDDKIRAKITAVFDLQNAQMNFNPLDALTPENDQLNVSGSMKLDKTLDLKGNLYLQNPTVGGSFLKANMDSSGRLQIPLMIKGSLLSPQMSFAAETIKMMAGKTLEYEKNQAVKNVKQSAQKEIEKAAKEQLKKILGN